MNTSYELIPVKKPILHNAFFFTLYWADWYIFFPSIFVDVLWKIFGHTFCGHFSGQFFGHILLTLFVNTFCEPFLWTLFVDTFSFCLFVYLCCIEYLHGLYQLEPAHQTNALLSFPELNAVTVGKAPPLPYSPLHRSGLDVNNGNKHQNCSKS